MEFTTPTYQLLYELEQLGLCRPPRNWDLMRESDIMEHILTHTAVVTPDGR
jgi:hypothetical protein